MSRACVLGMCVRAPHVLSRCRVRVFVVIALAAYVGCFPCFECRLGSERPENLTWEEDCLGEGRGSEISGDSRPVKRLGEALMSLDDLSSIQRRLVDGEGWGAGGAGGASGV